MNTHCLSDQLFDPAIADALPDDFAILAARLVALALTLALTLDAVALDFSISLRAVQALAASPVRPVVGLGVWVPVRVLA